VALDPIIPEWTKVCFNMVNVSGGWYNLSRRWRRAAGITASVSFAILKHTEACRVSPVIQWPAVMGRL
jgi:hypothetical protein